MFNWSIHDSFINDHQPVETRTCWSKMIQDCQELIEDIQDAEQEDAPPIEDESDEL